MEYRKIETSVKYETSVKMPIDHQPLLGGKVKSTSKRRTAAHGSQGSISTRGSSEVCVDDPVPHEFLTAFKKIIPLLETLDPPERQWIEDVIKLYDSCCSIFSYAHEYDLNPDTPYNGFRSFNQMVLSYFNCIIRICCKLSASTNRRRRNKCIKKLFRFKALIPCFMSQLALLDCIRQRAHSMVTSDFSDENSIDEKILFAILDVKESTLIPFFTSGAMNFWLSKSLSKFLRRFYLPMIPLKLYPRVTAMRSFVSADLSARLYADYAVNASLRDLRKLWSTGQSIKCSQQFAKRVTNFTGKFKVKTWYLYDRQNEWIINGEVGQITRNPKVKEKEQNETKDSIDVDSEGDETMENKKPIKCKVIRYRNRRSREKVSENNDKSKSSLVLHIHGGGFIAGSPNTYIPMLKSWVKTTKVTVVSIDYSKAPEHKYPVALQECLDVYLHLVLGCKGGGRVTGLPNPPTRVVIAGDSAGGNLSLGLAIALSEINRIHFSTSEVAGITMPISLCLQYPSVTGCLGVFSPSRVLFDSILTPVSRFIIAPAYSNNLNYFDDGKTTLGGNGTPWYRKDFHKTREIVQESLQKLSDPFYHLLSYRYFHQLSSVKLYIQAAQFDPLLDDSVELARAWSENGGEVILDVVERVTHGFVSFSSFSRECKLASDLVLRRVNQSLQLTD